MILGDTMKKPVMTPAEILARFPKTVVPGPTLAQLLKKRAELELELARALAVETFLDCDYKKVKVSKRIAKAPKSKIRAKSTRCVAESLKGSKPTIRTSSVFN
jgi:hypothetical protein